MKRWMTLLLAVLLLNGCSTKSENNPSGETEAENISQSKEATAAGDSRVTYDEDDFYREYNDADLSRITFSGQEIEVSGNGADVSGNLVTITAAGTYLLSGTLTEGNLLVDVSGNGTVRLIFNNVSMHCSDSAPVYIKQAEKTVISLPEGTRNDISDGEDYALETDSSEPNAAIFCKDDLTLNGTGTLTVTGNYNNGITCRDDLRIMEGNYLIRSVNNGIVGRDMLAVKDGSFQIDSDGDGMKSNHDSDEEKGFIYIEGGDFQITAGSDGIQAETALLIYGGDFEIETGGGSGQSDSVDDSSCKGLKAGNEIVIYDGTFAVNAADDGIHSNGSVLLEGGDFYITTGDDGIHSDASLEIREGNIDIAESYEGLESALITIEGGSISIVSSDDGINISGGRDQSGIGGRGEENEFQSSGADALHINGGYIYVNADGDGLDSNGSIYMTGGTVVVDGPTSGMDGALDFDKNFEISGGSLIAAGSIGMMEVPEPQDGYFGVVLTASESQAAGTIFRLEDQDGNDIVTFAPAKTFQSVVVCSPDLQEGKVCQAYLGGTVSGSETNGLYQEPEYSEGTLLASFTIEDSLTYLNEEGVTEASSFGFGRPSGGGGPGMGERPYGDSRKRPDGDGPPDRNRE